MTDTPEAADADAADSNSDATAEPSAEEEPSSDVRQPRRSRLELTLGAAGLVVVLVALSLVGARMLGWWPGEEEPAAAPSPTPVPTEAPSPFAGTPAEDFAEGEAGIVLPEAEPIGDFTAEEVAEALEQVRRALIAARLDHTMLVDHNPDEFLALLAPDHQPFRRVEFDGGESGYATQVAGDAALSAPPRVDGRISYGTATVERGFTVIEVVTAFIWVYAFEASDTRPGGIVVVRDELVWEMRDERWAESSHGLWLGSSAAAVWGTDCDAYDQGLLRPVVSTAVERNDADTIFDPAQPLESSDSC